MTVRPTVTLVLLLALGGCGSPAVPAPTPTTAPAAPMLPARTSVLPLDRADPCQALTESQRDQLGVEDGHPNPIDSDGLGSRDCQWSNLGGPPDNKWLVRAVVKRGAEYAMSAASGVEVVSVAGFPAVQTSPALSEWERNCVLLLDVADGQNLWVQYDNFAGDMPGGPTHEKACQQSRRVAEMAVQTLRAQAR